MKIAWVSLLIAGCVGNHIEEENEAIKSKPNLTATINKRFISGERNITVPSGNYVLSDTVVIPSGATLRLGSGTYDCAAPFTPGLRSSQFIMHDGSQLICDGWGTTLLEPPSAVYVDSAADFVNGSGPGDSNWSVSNCLFKGRSVIPITSQSSIALGNSSGILLNHLKFDGTHAYSIEIGGSSGLGNHSHDVWIRDSVFGGVSEGIALVNGDRVHINDNSFTTVGVLPIDVEPNEGTDIASFIAVGNAGLSMQVQGTVTGPAVIAANIANAMAIHSAHDILISSNTWGPTAAAALDIWGGQRILVSSNSIYGSGFPDNASNANFPQAALPVVVAQDQVGTGIWSTSDSLFTGNLIQASENKVGSTIIAEVAQFNASDPPDRNAYMCNSLGAQSYGNHTQAPPPAIVTKGANSAAVNNFYNGPVH